jgi:hypothetical protein
MGRIAATVWEALKFDQVNDDHNRCDSPSHEVVTCDGAFPTNLLWHWSRLPDRFSFLVSELGRLSANRGKRRTLAME